MSIRQWKYKKIFRIGKSSHSICRSIYLVCGSGAGCGSGSGSGLGEGSGSTTSNPMRCISIIINTLTTYLIALQEVFCNLTSCNIIN